ncbi:uncharacterized protein LOC103317583 isoform X1 [Nasonia vitripennis]|uniref:Uncharacterized protein n=1 Tax=Nasonia vitripennis TaxID=7425 RepID=A0A7M7Q4Y6_NASVI|nr:uncharacterized protein LOC103317583 isoform X1 [Nasonia vitripennis]
MCYVRKYAITMLLKGLKNILDIKELPSDARTLLKTPRSIEIIELASGIYSHYGLEKALHNQLESIDLNEIDGNKIFVQFSIDGLPLSKSSDTQLWPILGKIVGVENSNVFVVSAWYGSGKPSSANGYLEPFIHEYLDLNSNFVHRNITYLVYFHSLVADTVARNFVCCFPAHNSRCGRCIETGETINHRRVFLEMDSTLRNDINYRFNLPVQYQNVISPLEGVEGISITKQVPLDPMHLFSGVMLKLGLIYYNQYGQGIDASVRQGQLNRTYVQFNEWIPDEFVRGTRTLDQIDKFKCTELRLLLMYMGPVIFVNYITNEQMQNFNALNCAVRILSDSSECIKNNSCAKNLMIYFVQTMIELYGKDSVIYNVHNTIHIWDDFLNFGALNSFSAYPYENHLRTLKRMVVKGSYALSQIMNKINERSFISSATVDANKLGKDKFRLVVCSKIVFKNFILSCQIPNNCCLMEDKSIVVIEKIYHHNSEPVVLGRKYLDSHSLDNYPIDSRLIGINKSNRLSDLQEWTVNEIKKNI